MDNKTFDVLKENNFKFKKAFGQNFITDTNLLAAIVSDASIENDIVVEIGPGAGTLTKEIAKKAKHVYAFEIDENLKGVLNKTLDGINNVDVIYKDIQKVKDNELIDIIGTKDYKVVANLPYYITTPIIMKFLEGEVLPKSITIMVQKEVAERLVADAGTSEFGAITLAIKLYGDAKIKRIVSRKMFTPQPNVDSAIVNIEISNKYDGVDKDKVKKLIKAAFLMRRKTLVNNICSVYKKDKEEIIDTIKTFGFDEKVRGEELDIKDYIALANKI